MLNNGPGSVLTQTDSMPHGGRPYNSLIYTTGIKTSQRSRMHCHRRKSMLIRRTGRLPQRQTGTGPISLTVWMGGWAWKGFDNWIVYERATMLYERSVFTRCASFTLIKSHYLKFYITKPLERLL